MQTKSGTFASAAVLSIIQEQVAFKQKLFAGYLMGDNAILVDKCDLQICKIEKTILAFGHSRLKAQLQEMFRTQLFCGQQLSGLHPLRYPHEA
jgi:hypothetical protein